MREIPSLSRLLDVHLKVEVVDGPVTTIDHMQTCTVSIPADAYVTMTGDEVELLYLRPMVKALGEKINSIGNVKVRELPMPKKMVAFSCTKGSIPIMLTIAHRMHPDRYQLTLYALVEPVNANSN